MSSPSPGDGDREDLAAAIFSEQDYIAGQPPVRKFKPWHFPRKQFVRRTQWAAQALRVFDGRGDRSPVKYLGLPGIDLLDLRYLYDQICIPLGRPLRFLGFNSEARGSSEAAIDLNTSIDEVNRLGDVDTQSEVISDDFRSLGRKESMGWQKARRLGPFDVVNLDFCDGIAADEPDKQSSLYDAVTALLSLQVRSPNRWVLLVTTRIGRSHFHDDALSKLLDRFNGNIRTCEEFAVQCGELLDLDDPGSIDPDACEGEVFLRMTLVALCKWLMAVGQTQSPNRVELASCQAYRVNPGAPCEDLVSFALVFTPVIQPPADALQASPSPGVDECSEAARIARRVKRLKDVDSILAGNPVLVEELTQETETLLVAARYDDRRYREWLASAAVT